MLLRRSPVDHVPHTRTQHDPSDSPHKCAIASPTATHRSFGFRLNEAYANREPLANPDFHRREHPRVGEYHLIELLGRGGQGEIWKALRTEPRIEFVALKLLSREAKDDPARRARFRREAERGAYLAHPGILPVFEFGQDGTILFFVMPLVHGCALSEILIQRRRCRAGHPPLQVHRFAVLPEEQYIYAAVRVLALVARALDDVHAARVVHCDVKPANVLLDWSNENRSYLIDFGMGREVDAMPRTRAAHAAGTVLYMAPEKLSGHEVDEALCDVYALGATAFEALTLRPPRMIPKNIPQLLWAKYLAMRDPPRPSSLLPRLPEELDAILHRALSRDPKRRYSSAGLMADDLEEFLLGTRSSGIRDCQVSPRTRIEPCELTC
jgi:serine/threonine protein kinase